MKRIPHIAFIGDLTVDKYVESGERRLGGAALNGAVWAKRAGASAVIVTALGTDEYGLKFTEKIKQEKIDGTNIRFLPGDTSSIEIHINAAGERSYGSWNPGTLRTYHIRKSDITRMKKVDAVSVTVYPQYLHVLDELRTLKSVAAKKPLIAVNFGDMHEFQDNPGVVEDYLHNIDIGIFGLNKDSDEAYIQHLHDLAATHGKYFLVTLGKYGSTFIAGKSVFLQAPRPVAAVDTTGAGDAFLSGFLVEYCRSRDIRKSLSAGTDLASDCITKLGAY